MKLIELRDKKQLKQKEESQNHYPKNKKKLYMIERKLQNNGWTMFYLT